MALRFLPALAPPAQGFCPHTNAPLKPPLYMRSNSDSQEYSTTLVSSILGSQV